VFAAVPVGACQPFAFVAEIDVELGLYQPKHQTAI